MQGISKGCGGEESDNRDGGKEEKEIMAGEWLGKLPAFLCRAGILQSCAR